MIQPDSTQPEKTVTENAREKTEQKTTSYSFKRGRLSLGDLNNTNTGNVTFDVIFEENKFFVANAKINGVNQSQPKKYIVKITKDDTPNRPNMKYHEIKYIIETYSYNIEIFRPTKAEENNLDLLMRTVNFYNTKKGGGGYNGQGHY